MIQWLTILAQIDPPAGPGPNGGEPRGPGILGSLVVPMALIFIVVMLMSSSGRKKEKKKRQAMLDALKKHDKVMTIGGAIGTVMDVRDGEVTLKVDESSNTRMRFSQSSIQKVMTEEDKAQSAEKK